MGRAETCSLLVVALALCGPASSGAEQKGSRAAVNLFEDATDLSVQLRKAISGRIMIDELTLYADSATLDIQDPRRKENIDRYSYRDGAIREPVPVKLSGDYTQEDLDASVFPLESIDFSLIPRMIQDAKERLKMPDGKTTVLTLKRGWPFNDDVRWHVGVSNVRHTGSVEYDLKGRKKSVFKE